jgi:hypothetical protein
LHTLKRLVLLLEPEEIRLCPLVAATFFERGDLGLEGGFVGCVAGEGVAVGGELLGDAVEFRTATGNRLGGVAGELFAVGKKGWRLSVPHRWSEEMEN